ncbi:cation diffusion facilitator family transporter [Salinibius halmophilus]|uniref:cation diffusion facilitator family transporter n=1 Tax=Salinibius halmophilus TaxID=1853216 RepID=UPI000E65EF94|nr:cation diffusion facilitator family transporter [Salinibius halmophilus]
MSTERQRAIKRVTLIGAVLDGALAIAKVFGGLAFQSAALIADGIHSASDIVTDIFVLMVNKHAAASPDAGHPYGHARFETIGTAALGAVLVIVAAGLAWEIIAAFMTGLSSQLSPLALVVAAISVVSKEWIFHYTMRVAKQTESSLLAANAWHSRSDALSSIVVFIGLLGALMGVHWLEPAAAIVVAIMIGRMGIELVINALQELADKGLSDQQYRDVELALSGVQGVVGTHQLRARWHAGKALLDLHVQVDPHLSVSEGHLIGDRACQAIRDKLPQAGDITVHIDCEPDTLTNVNLALPNRLQVEDAVQQVNCLADWDNLQLHYLAGKVEVDLYYSGANQERTDGAKALATQHEWLRVARVWHR